MKPHLAVLALLVGAGFAHSQDAIGGQASMYLDPVTRYFHVSYRVPQGAPDEVTVRCSWSLHGQDEWRHAVGIEWVVRDELALRAGASHADHMVENSGLSPLSYDGDDTRFYAGLGFRRERWNFDFAAVYKLPDTRRVSPDDALVFPGKYRTGDGVLVLFSLSREAG